jgi:DNA polymerase III delta prime subunit
LTRGDAITPEPIAWLWPDWLAAGKLHILAGAPGTGKTTLALALAAAITRGGLWPDRTPAELGSVAMWSGEDDPKDVLIPRLLAMGADTSRVHIVSGITGPGGRAPYDPARDTALLAEALRDVPDVRLLLVDPIVSAVSGDSHHNAETRRSLQPLVDLAAERRCALLGITHLSKGTAGRDPVERVTGSLAFGALARVVLMAFCEQPEEGAPGRRLFVRAKSNIGPDTGGYVYELRQDTLPSHPGIAASSVLWGAAVEGTARELMAVAEQANDEPTTEADAANFLRGLLADGPRAAKTIYADAEAAGYSRDAMKRAKRRIGASARKQGMAGGWLWHLPEERTEGSEGSGLESLHSSHSSAPFATADGIEGVRL